LFDLIVDILSTEAGQERKSLPGLWVGAAPRRSARLRGQDRVMLFFGQTGTALLAPNLQQEMLSRLADTYFNTAGSVTAAMRVTVERLNDFLLNRNLRGARQGGTVVGTLGMAVLHGSSLYVLLAGPAHVYLLGPEQCEHFQDPTGRGLGQARLVSQRFFTSTVGEAGWLLFTAEPPGEWTDAALRGWAGLPAEELRRRLAGQALNLSAGVVRLQAGRGEVTWLASQAVEAPPKAAARATQKPQAVPARSGLGDRLAGVFLSGKALRRGGEDAAEKPAGTREASVETPATQPAPLEEPIPTRTDTQAADVAAFPAHASSSAPAPDLPLRQRPVRSQMEDQPQRPVIQRPAPTPVKPVTAPARPQGPSPAAVAAAKAATGVFGGVRGAWKKFGGAVSRLVARAIPGQPAEGLQISPASMLFIALAVPLVVVAVAATVYFQRGRGEQYQAYLHTAQQFAEQAAAQQDLGLQREDWNQTLYWLDKAGGYGQSADGDNLRQKARTGLDGMDGIVRLNYLPAGNPMPEGTNISRMVATINDVYMLDSTTGSVFRLFRTGSGYELDLQFKCGPGKAGTAQIGPLLDIAALPPNNDFKATLIGIDAGGNLEYCAPGVAGFSSTMLVAPDANWGKISRMVLFQDVLYVMDPQVNAIYRYYGDKGSAFTSGPRLYFENQVPTMTDVVDIAVDQEYLYLLHEDGSMTTCSDAGFTTECSDPAPYGDARQGRMSEPLRFDDAKFLRLQSTQPPDPSLYVLDTEADSVYQFSLRKLNLQRQFRPLVEQDYPLPDQPPTGFVVTPNRKVLLAFGKQAFYASLP